MCQRQSPEAGRIPPLGIGVPKSGSSGIREHGRLNVQRRLFGV